MVLGDGGESGVFFVVRFGASGQSFSQGFDRFRPERAAAADAGFWPRVIQPSSVQVQGGKRKVAAITVPESAVDAQQQDCIHRHACGREKATDLLRAEQFGALLCAVDAKGFLRRPLEPLPIAHRAVNQAVVPGRI
jgi:hypothetical protein